MFLDKLGLINLIEPAKKENIAHNPESSLKKIIPKKDIKECIPVINKINTTIEFLISMKNSKLIYELYRLMEGQVQIYDEYGTHRVLELTSEQFSIFSKNNIEMEIFKKEPFLVDSILVYEKRKINYKFFNSEAEINKFIVNYNRNHETDEGLYFLTSNTKGYLGKGLYVCDKDDENSDCLFNNLVRDRLSFISRNSNRYIYFLEGEYSGLIKRCVLGELEGVCILVDSLIKKPIKNKEELYLYGEIDSEEYTTLTKDEEFNLKLQENLPDLNIKLSSVDCEIIEGAMG